MKTTILKSTFILALFSGVFFSCVKDENYSIPNLDCVETSLVKTKDLSQITFPTTLTQFTTDEVIEAYVTSSDAGGNFYKSISFQNLEGTIGFSVPVDVTTTFTSFEPGRKVLIKLKDLYAKKTAVKVIGNQIGDYFDDNGTITVGRLSEAKYRKVLNKSCTVVSEETLVKKVTINEAKNDAMLNILIEIDNVQFDDSAITTTYFDPLGANPGGSTNHNVIDMNGNSMIFRTSEFSNYATKPVATGNGTLRGIMTKYNGDYQFVVRTEADIKLTNDRVDIDFFPPIIGNGLVYDSTLNEPFTSYTANNQENFPKYINDAAEGSRYWQRKTFGGNTYIQVSSFGGGNTDTNRSLFIVPVNMTAANTLSFKTNDGFNNGATLKVFYTTDYVPGNQITTATLVDITSNFTISSGNTSGYGSSFTNSGVYNIPASVTGNGFFVFQYLGNGASGPTTTMQLDDIVIN